MTKRTIKRALAMADRRAVVANLGSEAVEHALADEPTVLIVQRRYFPTSATWSLPLCAASPPRPTCPGARVCSAVGAAGLVMTDTFDLHRTLDGELSVERSLLHGAILIDLFRDAPRHAHATVVFLAGGPASGKSTLAKRLGLTAGAVLLDVDDVRARLPEYAEWRSEGRPDAAALTHREASQLVRVALGMALRQGVNVVLDGVGGDDDGGFSAKIAATIASGASVRVCYATVSVDVALKREQQRFADTGRHVPDMVLRAAHGAVSRGLDNVARLEVESIEIYDTGGPEPSLLAHGPGGLGREALAVVDPEGYADFVAKGQS